jgi:hypothetical protein
MHTDLQISNLWYYTSFGWRHFFPENSIWNTAVPLLSYWCMFQVEICSQQLEICKSVCMFINLAIVVETDLDYSKKKTQGGNLKCQILIQHFSKIVLYWCLDLIRHNIGTHLKHNKYISTIRNLQIRVHVYQPRNCCGDWLTFGCFVPMIADHDLVTKR